MSWDFLFQPHFRNHLTTPMKTATATLTFPLIWCSSSLGFRDPNNVNLVQKLRKQANPNDERNTLSHYNSCLHILVFDKVT